MFFKRTPSYYDVIQVNKASFKSQTSLARSPSGARVAGALQSRNGMTLNCHSPWPEVNAVFLYLRMDLHFASVRSLNLKSRTIYDRKGYPGCHLSLKRVAVLLGDVVKFSIVHAKSCGAIFLTNQDD
ncbi:hypothetical protein TNCV_1995891 [Trichonephila clavipes]|nr:hypothetical protein TNCV_1995891 [Trichonephila clavipes]